MNRERALELVRNHGRAVLATMRQDGTPQMSPVLVVADDEGRLLVSTRETAMKTRNVRRHPHAWVCAITDRFFGDWAQLGGSVEVISLPDAMDLLVDYYRRAAGEHDDWAEYHEAMRREQRCILRISVDRVGPSVSG